MSFDINSIKKGQVLHIDGEDTKVVNFKRLKKVVYIQCDNGQSYSISELERKRSESTKEWVLQP